MAAPVAPGISGAAPRPFAPSSVNSGSVVGGTVSYTYTLQDPVSNALGSDQATESFAIGVNVVQTHPGIESMRHVL